MAKNYFLCLYKRSRFRATFVENRFSGLVGVFFCLSLFCIFMQTMKVYSVMRRKSHFRVRCCVLWFKIVFFLLLKRFRFRETFVENHFSG